MRYEYRFFQTAPVERKLFQEMKVRDVLRRIEADGWRQVAQRGSHRQFKHPEKRGRVTVAGHPSEEMDEGTRKSIFRQAGIER